jgi:hypothetical protein
MSGLDGVVGEAKIAGNWSRGGVWSCRGTRYAELFLILYLYLIDRVGRGYVFCCSSLAQCTAAESIVCVCQRRAIEEDCSIAQRGMSRGEVMSARV